jgi:hypothetical protein
LLRQLYTLALQHNLSIRAVHRPGVDNTLADFLSRPALHRDDPVAVWQATHPLRSLELSSVSLVVSEQFVNSSTLSPASLFASTHNAPTPPASAYIAHSAAPSA